MNVLLSSGVDYLFDPAGRIKDTQMARGDEQSCIKIFYTIFFY